MKLRTFLKLVRLSPTAPNMRRIASAVGRRSGKPSRRRTWDVIHPIYSGWIYE